MILAALAAHFHLQFQPKLTFAALDDRVALPVTACGVPAAQTRWNWVVKAGASMTELAERDGHTVCGVCKQKEFEARKKEFEA
jgi:hypothetical protein